mmetsp:Transcript_17597/g.35051  ORF Transcript_17597/g.35051 Transcript_17597/m.35051 type:complete len:179 (+) Transcript_17597:337-873(+)
MAFNDTETAVTKSCGEESKITKMIKSTAINMKPPELDLMFLCLPQCKANALLSCGGVQNYLWERETSESSVHDTKKKSKKESCLQKIVNEAIKSGVSPSGEDAVSGSKKTSTEQPPLINSQDGRTVMYPKPVRRLKWEEMQNLYKLRPDLDIGSNESLDMDVIDWDEVDEAAGLAQPS